MRFALLSIPWLLYHALPVTAIKSIPDLAFLPGFVVKGPPYSGRLVSFHDFTLHVRHAKSRTTKKHFVASYGSAAELDAKSSAIDHAKLRPATLIADLKALAAPFWQGERRSSAIMWSAGTLLLSLFSTAYAVAISFVNKFFWNALSAKDLPKYNKFLLIYILALSLGPPFLVLYDWFKSRMALAWRTALTERYLDNYVSQKKYYKIPIVAALDNADQRIADDVRAVTDKATRPPIVCRAGARTAQ